jgi:hypothetical protein
VNWQKLDMLAGQFAGNCAALARRDAALAERLRAFTPAAPYVISTDGGQLTVARRTGETVDVVPQRVPPAGAQQIADKLCPTGVCADGILVAGVDQGWLWHLLHQLPTAVATAPGHRRPLFYLAPSIEELWLAAHLHDWRDLLADPRVILAAGDDAYAQLQAAFHANPAIPLPRLSVTLDARAWPPGKSLDSLTTEVMAAFSARMQAANERLRALDAAATEETIADRLQSGAKRRVLGVTSAYTTFLQHSMRDWLAAFAADGHETRLLIERADHEQLNSLAVAEACAEFRPDLIVLIDHYRAELGGMPLNVPAVMWIQDYLPNMFAPAAGAAQKRFDYAIGYNRTECTTRFGYPHERFMPAMVVVNEERFAPPELSADDRRRFECDVCFVSHASKPADEIIQQQIKENPTAKALLSDAYERLKAIYDQGHSLSHPLHIRAIVQEACLHTRLQPDAPSLQRITDLFTHRVNNALFRHQAVGWAADTGANLHLYGNGWESHPRFAKFAKGPADNATHLRKIYRATKIHLQATPHGAVHQRLLEGLASGGFFLVRYVPADMLERVYQPLCDWCIREGIRTDDELMRRATPDVLKMLGEVQRRIGVDPFKLNMSLVDDLRTGHDTGWARSAATVWPEYETVAFDSAALLRERIGFFLANHDERARVAAAMREKVVERLTYRAVNRRMLQFISDELNSRTLSSREVAAA